MGTVTISNRPPTGPAERARPLVTPAIAPSAVESGGERAAAHFVRPGRDVAGALVGCVLLLAMSSDAAAANWDIVPRFSAGETYSDNINLVPTGEIGDFITEFTPGVSVRGDGARLQLNVDYNLQNLKYASESDLDAMNHQLQANSTAELVENMVFFDTHALMTQALVDPTGPVSNSNVSGSTNRTDALNYGFEPYVRHHLGAWADAEARLRYEATNFEQSSAVTASNSTTTGNVLSVSSGRRFQRLRWSATYDVRKIDYDAGTDNEFKNLGFTVGWAVHRYWRLDATIGHEDNSYASVGTRDTGGISWTLGAAWTPSPRTDIGFGIGERYFGRTFYFKGKHRARRLVFSGNYREEPSSASQSLAGQQLIPLLDANGLPVFDPDQASRIPLDGTTPRLLDDVFISSQLDLAVDYQARRGGAQLRIYDISREYESGLAGETVSGFSASVSRTLSRRLSVGATFSRDTQQSDAAAETARYSLSPYANYQIGPRLSAIFQYLYYRADSDNAFGSYRENQISAFLSFAL